MELLQFRRLYREFLFRMVELDFLSSHARGDLRKLLGQIASLLIFLSILFSIPGLNISAARDLPQIHSLLAWSGEHFLIATTMLVVGLFAVLQWDSPYPSRHDVLVLAPLPVRARTIFLAKIAGVATALALAVATLHVVAGFVWPLCLNGTIPAHRMPQLTTEPAAAVMEFSGLALNPGDGIAVGISNRGERRIVALGAAKRDSIFQIGSITKPLTALLLAQMATQGTTRLNEPVRELLPAGTVNRPAAEEITLLDLVTHHSGLPPLPANLNRRGKPNPGADYRAADLYRWLASRGVARPARTAFQYSNAGFGLLGEALANRSGVPYAGLLRRSVAEPLGMPDTAVTLSPAQRDRVIPAFDAKHRPVPPWELDALAGAGAVYSTAGDLLAFLEANLHPERSPFPAALMETQKRRASAGRDMEIGMAWIFDNKTSTYLHSGAISGYTSHAFFQPESGRAGVVLVNNGPGSIPFSYLIGRHLQEALAGSPAVSLSGVIIPPGGGAGGFIRLFAAYWATMIAAAVFVFCGVLTVQGAAAQLLPRWLFLRVSSWIQMAVFCLLVSVYFLQPMAAAPDSLIEAQRPGWLAWSPSFWFLGLFQRLNGSPALSHLAAKALTGLAAVLAGTALAYGLSYIRTLRQIVEEPGIVSGFRRGDWLPRIGGAFSTATVRFSIRSFLRSRHHRILLAFYLGIAFAITIFLLRSPAAQRQLFDAPPSGLYDGASPQLIAASLIVMGFWIVGVRVAFSIPVDPRCRWIFQLTADPTGVQVRAARRRAMALLSAVPAWVLSAGLFFWLWPWQLAAGHLLVLALLAAILVELCVGGEQKLPFTCSYLPGKSNFHLTFWLCIGLLVQGITFLAEFEQKALEQPKILLAFAAALAGALAALRLRQPAPLVYEAGDAGATQELGLSG